MAASKQVPYLARLLITTIEPIFALGGIYLLLTSPESYVSQLSRGRLSGSPTLDFMSPSQAGSWMFFAFTEGVVFRAVDDLRTWRWLCAGMLLSDGMYCHHVALGVGGWSVWANIAGWTAEDWLVSVTTLPFLLVRVLILIGFWGSGSRAKTD